PGPGDAKVHWPAAIGARIDIQGHTGTAAKGAAPRRTRIAENRREPIGRRRCERRRVELRLGEERGPVGGASRGEGGGGPGGGGADRGDRGRFVLRRDHLEAKQAPLCIENHNRRGGGDGRRLAPLRHEPWKLRTERTGS